MAFVILDACYVPHELLGQSDRNCLVAFAVLFGRKYHLGQMRGDAEETVMARVIAAVAMVVV